MNLLLYRDNDESFFNGSLSEKHYAHDQKKRLTSLNGCYIGWLTEMILVISFGIALVLNHYGIPYVFYPFFEFLNVIIRVIVLPLIQMITSDERAKKIIREENWYQGLRWVIGIYKKVSPAESELIRNGT